MAVPDAVPDRPDALACLASVEARPGLRPSLDAAGILHAARWSGADRGAVRPAVRRMAVVIPEVRPDLKAAGAGKLAVREPRPEDAVPDRRASAVRQESLAGRVRPRAAAAAEQYRRAEARSAA